MADDNLTFDDMLFSNSRQASEQQLSTLLGDSKLTVNTSKSPMFPDAPYPTTTVTPVLTPSVNKPEWNYTATLEEAFPDAQFEDTEDDEVLTLMEWLKLQDFESPDEDYRLACFGDSDSEEDSEEDDNDSDDFDETPYGTGIGGGWL